jgi:adenine/guanine/hypoxanthine permease
MMAQGARGIEWDELEYAIPAFVTVVAMPLTYSIANGIALGLVLFPLLMVFKGRPGRTCTRSCTGCWWCS